MEETKDGSSEHELKRETERKMSRYYLKNKTIKARSGLYSRKKTSCLVVYNGDLIMNKFKQINREICTHFNFFGAKPKDLETHLSLFHRMH